MRYVDLGLSVFPLPCGSKVPARGFRWTEFRERRAEAANLLEWFGGDQQPNIAIVTGDISGGLVVRDFDEERAYDRWRDSHRDVAETLPTVRTARGFHVYARGQAARTKTYDDGELRAGGSYVLAPSSLHPSGVVYTWTHLPGDIPAVDLCAAGLCNTEAQEAQKPTQFCASVLHASEAVRLAVRRCIPPGPNNRHKCLFRLARELKAVPEVAGLQAAALETVLKEWHCLSLPYIGTKDFATSWLEFCVAWERVRYPAGVSPVADAWEAAVAAGAPPEVASWDNPQLGLLAALCRELQRLQGDRPFYLDASTAGNLVGVDRTIAWRWLRGLASAGILELVRSGSRGRANEYRYLMPVE
ncbi:MAG: bifunctional DNA primase/polymerase [Pirellulales bacterium]|nr:bifunctional DNA primase/polymerase [Pirellulales bacterium]